MRHTGSEEAERELMRLLLSLANRLPDDLVTRLRTRLTEGQVVEVAHAVVFAALAGPVPLTESEAGLLIATLAGAGEETGMARAVKRADSALAAVCSR